MIKVYDLFMLIIAKRDKNLIIKPLLNLFTFQKLNNFYLISLTNGAIIIVKTPIYAP